MQPGHMSMFKGSPTVAHPHLTSIWLTFAQILQCSQERQKGDCYFLLLPPFTSLSHKGHAEKKNNHLHTRQVPFALPLNLSARVKSWHTPLAYTQITLLCLAISPPLCSDS